MNYTINDLQEYASFKGGICLSKEYCNIYTKYKWMCSKGHIWKTTYPIIKKIGWCPECRKVQSKEEKLNELKLIAKEKGGACLSNEYVTAKTPLLWKCKEGHQWKASPNQIKSCDSWCPSCANAPSYTLKDIHEIATKKGGICLSKVYINSKTKLEFMCSEGHVWKTLPYNVFKQYWCPICSMERRRDNIETYRKIAAKHGGRLLSKKYIHCKMVLIWECSKGHKWEAVARSIKYQKSWCPICAGHFKYDIKYMKELATKRGGKCLSKKYVNGQTKLEFQCSKGHVWNATPNNIINNRWCRICSYKTGGDKRRHKIETYQKIALERGGKLLSDKYINNCSPLLWECKNGHQWKTTPKSVKNLKTWCPHCKRNARKI
ncbi:MAG: hypothetical protein ABR968_13070 [Bacteroidales bacterium]|jgi:hypothetical protein